MMRRGKLLIWGFTATIVLIYTVIIWILTLFDLTGNTTSQGTAILWTGAWFTGFAFACRNLFNSSRDILKILTRRLKNSNIIDKDASIYLIGSWWFARSDTLQLACCVFMTLAGWSVILSIGDMFTRTALICLGGLCIVFNQIFNLSDREELEAKLEAGA